MRFSEITKAWKENGNVKLISRQEKFGSTMTRDELISYIEDNE